MKFQQQFRSVLSSRASLAVFLAGAAACSGNGGSGSRSSATGGAPSATGGTQPALGGAGGTGGGPLTTTAGVGGASVTGGSAAGGAGTGGMAGQAGGQGGGGKPDAPGDGGAGGGSGGTASHPEAGSGIPDAGLRRDGAAGVDARVTEAGPPSSGGFLHVEGNKLVDWRGKSVRLTGVNWFGLETNNQEPHGIWSRDYRSMVKQIAELGFNTLRLPWANQILRTGAKASDATGFGKSGPDAYDGTDPINAELVGKSPLEIMDKVIEAAGEFGVKIMLDNHSREPDGYMSEQVWFTDKTPEKQWIEDWVFLANRYAGNTTVVAADLDNEPHGIATWGKGDASTDWNAAAERCGNAILAANPDWVIVVEGTEKVGSDGYWWGGNLSGVKTNPIKLTDPSKLMYSTHEYGPEVHDQDWFSDAKYPSNLPALWTAKFDFIMQENLGHILIGEFGIKDRASASGRAGVWFDTVLAKLGTTYSWTFWCWNPNSGDTEGLLAYDWVTPVQWKIDALKAVMAPMIGK
jgi:aryl-phospho-beta-D-glucosidase BglC (GH1 family)